MSRRDTIIVAVLINAGLLIVLFASALRSPSPSSEQELVRAPQPAVQEVKVAQPKRELPVQGDEVDQVLSQYAQQFKPAVVEPVAPTPPPVSAPLASSRSFADEFKFESMPTTGPTTGPATAVTTPPSAPKLETALASVDHKVKKGDVLEKIARYHHCTVDQIMKLNQLTTTHLRIGQMLKIPTAKPSSSSSFPAETTPKYYIVKNGDTPWMIATRNHIKVEELLKLNHLDEEKARRLKPGDQLRIR